MAGASVLVSAAYKHELEKREDWDPDTLLFEPYEVEQVILPDRTNCLAVQTFLKMLKLPFNVQYRINAEFMSPSGKVPFIKCGQFVIADLERIIEFAQNKGHSLTKNLDEVQLCDMRAFMSLVNTVLGNAEAYFVWCDENLVPITEARFGSVYPFPLNYWVTYLRKRSSKKRLNAIGWLKKSLDQVYDEVNSCCKALSDRLGNGQYFFEEPTELDALVFGHLYTIASTPLGNNRLSTTTLQYDNLVQLCRRIEEMYFRPK